MDTAPGGPTKKTKKSKVGAGAATAAAPTKRKTKTPKPCSPAAAADDMLSALPPVLIEHILLASCGDGGSTEAIGSFAATSRQNALTVAESRPVWQAVMTKRFNAEFSACVLQKHSEALTLKEEIQLKAADCILPPASGRSTKKKR